MDYSITIADPADENDFYEISGMPPPPSLTVATAFSARLQLANEVRIRPASFFKIGMVLATGTPRPDLGDHVRTTLDAARPSYRVRVWLVAGKASDCCYCVRIRTYQGKGIKHLKDALEAQRLVAHHENYAASLEGVQKDIDAHAIIFPQGERDPYPDPEEPYMKKRSLAVQLGPGLGHEAIDRMSRACFTRLYRITYEERFASIGCLEKRSLPFLARYAAELFGEIH